MTVPSYDDLTPGIPDVIDSEAAGNLASLLRELPAVSSRLPASGFQSPARAATALYACLRLGPASGELEVGTRQLEAVRAVARDFSPRVREASAQEVLLDVSGLGRLIGPPPEIARQLEQALRDAPAAASVAFGPTQTIARVLARAMGEVAPERLRREGGHKNHEDRQEQTNHVCDLCGLRDLCAGACGRGPWLQLPVELLRELETRPPATTVRDRSRIYETLERWGIATLGELAALPPSELSSRLGRRGLALQRLARGLDPAPFVADADTPRYIGRLELEWPIDALEPLSFVLARLLDPLSAQLERADRAAAALQLELRLTDRSTHTRVLQLPAPMRDPRVLRTLLLLDLESNPPSPLGGFGETGVATAAIDVVSIELDPAPARITQFSLLRRALPSAETVATLTARLSALVGASRVGSPALIDSHRPDAFAMTPYAPDGPPSPPRGALTAAASERLLVLRRRRPPLPIGVSVERGRPVHVASSRKGVPCGAVTQATGPWRTSGEWWAVPMSGADAPVAPQPRSDEGGWNRDEWDVELKSGAVCRIYRDRTTSRWFFEGLYD